MPGIEKYCVPEKLIPDDNCVGVPVAVALFAFPDLSFQTVTVEPDRVMLAEDWSAPSNHSWQPEIDVGLNPPKNTSDILLRAAVLGFMLTTPYERWV